MHLSTLAWISAFPSDDPVTFGLAESHSAAAWEKAGREYLLLAGDLHWAESTVQFVFDYLNRLDCRKREEWIMSMGTDSVFNFMGLSW